MQDVDIKGREIIPRQVWQLRLLLRLSLQLGRHLGGGSEEVGMLDWYGVGTVLVWCWYGAGVVLVWYWYGMVGVRKWACLTGVVLVWYWYGIGMVLVWYWYGIGDW